MQIIIYGAPGAGKTTVGRLLHDKTNIELYEGDYLREVKLPEEIGDSDDPFLYVGTKHAWRNFGALNSENVIKGLKAVRNSMRVHIEKEINNYEDVIFEAAFLDPKIFQDTTLYLVITQDEDKHREQFFKERKFFHPKFGSSELEKDFMASRLIQEYLIKEAQKLQVTIVQNSSDQVGLLSQFKGL